jgi:hypothetical protein
MRVDYSVVMMVGRACRRVGHHFAEGGHVGVGGTGERHMSIDA